MEEFKDISHMPLHGGESCFDFINSGYNDHEDVITERLLSYNDLIILAERLPLLPEDRLKKLKDLASQKPALALEALKLAKQIREMMYRVLKSIAKEGVDSIDLSILTDFNNHLSNALSKQVFVVTEGQLVPALHNDEVGLNEPIWAFLISAYNVLRDKDQQRIKQCSACAWLYFDNTKNNTRKWCNMQSCGSIEKSKRYYQRKKEKNNK